MNMTANSFLITDILLSGLEKIKFLGEVHFVSRSLNRTKGVGPKGKVILKPETFRIRTTFEYNVLYSRIRAVVRTFIFRPLGSTKQKNSYIYKQLKINFVRTRIRG